jgi:hypothetical protein
MKKWCCYCGAVLVVTLVACGVPAPPLPSGSGATAAPTSIPETTPNPATPTPALSPSAAPGFSIYLIEQGKPPENATAADLMELVLEDSPLVSADDIESYSWQTHEIELTPAARRRVARLQARAMSGPGVPFVVCVGMERMYTGEFWTSYSSVPFDGIVIDVYPADQGRPVRIQLGYPSEEWFAGKDLRSDPRILQSLQAAGKLK